MEEVQGSSITYFMNLSTSTRICVAPIVGMGGNPPMKSSVRISYARRGTMGYSSPGVGRVECFVLWQIAHVRT